MLGLKFGKCRMVVAGFPEANEWITRYIHGLQQKYPNIANYFSKQEKW